MIGYVAISLKPLLDKQLNYDRLGPVSGFPWLKDLPSIYLPLF